MERNRLLLVDGDPFALESLARQLEQRGFDVTRASSAGSAIENLQSGRFGLVLTDLTTDNPDGLRVLEHARELLSEVPVIVLTGYGNVQATIESLRPGVDDYLFKPCDPEELFFRILTCIEHGRRKKLTDELKRLVAERTKELEELNRGLQERIDLQEDLLREVRHRVKNNLATISGLISLQGTASRHKSVEEVLSSLKQRVRAIYHVYEKVYDNGNLALIEYRDYVATLSDAIYGLISDESGAITVEIDMEPMHIDVDTAIPLGLVTAELLSNALTHAFPGERSGTVVLRLTRSDRELTLTVQDDGVGFQGKGPRGREETLGLRLIDSLVGQMDGTVDIRHGAGTTAVVRVPIAPRA